MEGSGFPLVGQSRVPKGTVMGLRNFTVLKAHLTVLRGKTVAVSKFSLLEATFQDEKISLRADGAATLETQ